MRNRLAGTVLLLAGLAACSAGVAAAHLTGFKLGKDKDTTAETSTFSAHDEVWAKTEVDNVSGKVTLRFGLVLVKVAGQPENLHNPGTDHRVELASGGTGTYHLTSPPSGWPGWQVPRGGGVGHRRGQANRPEDGRLHRRRKLNVISGRPREWPVVTLGPDASPTGP